MIANQWFATGRSDVLTYRSIPMDTDQTTAGPVNADLWVSTTGSDGDFIVKVIDEYPSNTTETSPSGRSLAGYQMLVRWEVMRGRFRDSYEKPKAFEPNKPTRVRFSLNDVLHTFRKGHKLVIQVQSSMFPLIDRNPNTFVESIYQAKNSDFVPATVRLYRSPRYPTHVEFGILK
jgi:hypothetical protein